MQPYSLQASKLIRLGSNYKLPMTITNPPKAKITRYPRFIYRQFIRLLRSAFIMLFKLSFFAGAIFVVAFIALYQWALGDIFDNDKDDPSDGDQCS